MGIEPTRPAWKAGILAIELHPHSYDLSILTQNSNIVKSFLKYFRVPNKYIIRHSILFIRA